MSSSPTSPSHAPSMGAFVLGGLCLIAAIAIGARYVQAKQWLAAEAGAPPMVSAALLIVAIVVLALAGIRLVRGGGRRGDGARVPTA